MSTITFEKTAARWDEIVRQQVKSLKFGVVQIVVHDGKVVQIERTENVRLDKEEGTRQTESPND